VIITELLFEATEIVTSCDSIHFKYRNLTGNYEVHLNLIDTRFALITIFDFYKGHSVPSHFQTN
jgi:hypothetical protein